MGGKTLRKQDTIYLDPEKFDLLEKLAKKTGKLRSELLRDAVDSLLTKHKLLKAPKKKPLPRDGSG